MGKETATHIQREEGSVPHFCFVFYFFEKVANNTQHPVCSLSRFEVRRLVASSKGAGPRSTRSPELLHLAKRKLSKRPLRFAEAWSCLER